MIIKSFFTILWPKIWSQVIILGTWVISSLVFYYFNIWSEYRVAWNMTPRGRTNMVVVLIQPGKYSCSPDIVLLFQCGWIELMRGLLFFSTGVREFLGGIEGIFIGDFLCCSLYISMELGLSYKCLFNYKANRRTI